MPPSLTLILPAWNVATNLRREVEHLLEILPELTTSFELLLVDDHSADHWTELAQELSRRFPPVSYTQIGPALSLPAIIAAARRRATELVLIHDGPSLSAHDLQRLLGKTSAPADAAAEELPPLTPSPRAFSHQLLTRLARWGEQLSDGAPPPTRPANFMAHLRGLAQGS